MPDSDKPRSTFTSEVVPTEGRPGYEDTVITTTTTTTDPVAAATELTESFQETAKAIKDLTKVPGRIRTLRVLMVLVFVLIAGLGGTVYAIRQVQLSGCRAGNDVRSGSLHIADTIEASLLAPRPDGRERTPEEIEQTEAFVADLRDDFALRDC